MCELLAMSARFPTNLRLSLDELARHGGQTGPHRDGWGVALLVDGDALLVREPEPACDSQWLAFLQGHHHRSSTVFAHIRKATQGPRILRNTQPFTRELAGRAHLFAHNGMLPGIEDDARFAAKRFRRVGDTDSEHAFCALLERLVPSWERAGDDVPLLDERIALVAAFGAELRTLGPANFLYTDGDAIFAQGDRRRHNDGQMRPPGLHLLCRSCDAGDDDVELAGITIAGDSPTAHQEVALLASVPLSEEHWQPLHEGEVVVLREGRVVHRQR